LRLGGLVLRHLRFIREFANIHQGRKRRRNSLQKIFSRLGIKGEVEKWEEQVKGLEKMKWRKGRGNYEREVDGKLTRDRK
jgi:hypothetical protein